MSTALTEMQLYMKDLRGQLENVLGLMNSKKYDQARDTILVELLGGQVSERIYEQGSRTLDEEEN